MIKKLITSLVISISLISLLLSGCSSNASTGSQSLFEVKRGDLNVVVSTDGSLNMPNNYNLAFGTMGTVQDILVKEGDKVKQGAILAFLDNTAQINAIKTALYNVRSAVNSLTTGAFGSETYTYQPPSYTLYGPTTYMYQPPPYIYYVWIPGEDGEPGYNEEHLVTPDPIPIPTWGEVGEATPAPINISMTTCEPLGMPNSYPEMSAPQIFEEAQKDLDEFIGYFNQGQYKDAGLKLGMMYFDIQVCEDLIKSRPDAKVYAGVKSESNSIYYPDGTAGTSKEISAVDASVIDYLEQYRARLLDTSGLMMKGAYAEITTELDILRQEALKGHQLVENTVRLRGRSYLTYPDVPTSLDFLQSSLRSLQELNKYAAQDGAKADEMTKKIYLAKLNLLVSRDVFQNDTVQYDLNSGFNWKSLQQYNLAVQSAEIALYKAKRDIMNTVIIAPVDGTVVSVNLKKDYVLSAQDYSSRPAIQLVDTSTIRFTGLVDEIDIMKVKVGQKAKITVDAVPDKVFTGTVKFISPFGTKSGQVVKFTVTIELDPTDAELRGALSATADIDTYTARGVLLVPVSAILTTPVGSMVMVKNEATGKTEPRKITVGKRNFQFVEVLSGLKEGEKILESNLMTRGSTSGSMPPGVPPGR